MKEKIEGLNEVEEITAAPLTDANLLKAEIFDRFQAVFGGVYNVVELSTDIEKAEKAKSLIGSILIRARDTIMVQVDNYIK